MVTIPRVQQISREMTVRQDLPAHVGREALFLLGLHTRRHFSCEVTRR
jgi:hypothetical protein